MTVHDQLEDIKGLMKDLIKLNEELMEMLFDHHADEKFDEEQSPKPPQPCGGVTVTVNTPPSVYPYYPYILNTDPNITYTTSAFHLPSPVHTDTTS